MQDATRPLDIPFGIDPGHSGDELGTWHTQSAMGPVVLAERMTAEHDLLVAYDDTDVGKKVAAFAAERAAKTGESVEVVHIGPDFTEAKLREAVGQGFEDHSVPASFRVIAVGGSDEQNVSVSATLVDHIDENDYTMVFMGNEERGLFHDLAEGSVTDAVLKDKLVPVVLVP